MPGPFDDLIPASRSSAPPAFIPGTPKPMTPQQVSAEERARRDQQMQERRDQETREKDEITKERDALKLESEKGRFVATGGIDGTEGENKAAALTTNLQSAMNNIRAVTKAAPSSAKPSWLEIGAGVFGEDAKEMAQTEERRDITGSQFIAIDSALTLATGAAYTPSQLQGYTRSLFPTISDTPYNIAKKRRKFEEVIQAGRLQAGAKAPNIEQAIAAVEAIYGPAGGDANQPAMTGDVPTGTDVEIGFNQSDGDQVYDRNRFLEQRGLDPNKEATMVAFWNQNRGNDALSPAAALRFYAENGIPPPSDNDLNRMIEDAKRGAQFGPVDTSADEAAYRAELEQGTARQGEAGLTEMADQGLLSGLSDEFAGVGGAISSLVRGDDPRLGYQFSRDVMRLQNQKADENTGVLGDVVELGAGLAVPLGAANTVGKAAKVGAIAGAVGGFGYGEGAGGSALGAVAGTALGAGVGAGGARIGNALANRASSKAGQVENRNALYTAAEELDMTRPARMFTEPELYAKTRAVSGTVVGSNPIQEGVQKFGDEIQAATTNALAQGKQPLERPTVGTIAQGAFNRTNDAKKTKTDNLYTAYQKASGDPAVVPTNAIATIDQEIADLARSPKSNKSEITFLQEYRDDLANGKMTVQTIRDMRTNLRGRINEKNLGMTKAEGRIQGVLDAAADDIAVTLDPKSKGYKLLTEANKSHADRVLYKKQLKADLIGKDADLPTDPGKAFETILTWTNPKGDLRKLKALQASFTPDEASDFAATVVNSISKDNNGNFSTAILLQKIEQLERAGKNTIETLFGPDGSKAIDNIKILAAEHKRVNGATAGQGSAFGNDWRSILTSVFAPAVVAAAGEGGVSLTTAVVGIGGLVVKAGRDAMSAKMLLSPKVTNWARSAPKTSDPKIIDNHFAKLGAIAKAQPALAADIKAFRDAILQAANDNTNRAVAQDGEGERGR